MYRKRENDILPYFILVLERTYSPKFELFYTLQFLFVLLDYIITDAVKP